MIAEGGLGLSGVKAQIYALIYSHSPADTLENDTGCYYGSIDYTAARTGASRRAVIDALKALLNDGLIIEKGSHTQGDNSTTKKYIVVREKAQAARDQFMQYWGLQNFESAPLEETAPEVINEHTSGVVSAPDYSCAGADNSPENCIKTTSREETSPGVVSTGVKTSPENEYFGEDTLLNQVQKLHPIKKGLSPLDSNPNHTQPKHKTEGMGRDEANQEIQADLDPECMDAIKTLMRRSINRRVPLSEVLVSYKQALEAGYTPELIAQGYEKYIVRYRKAHPDTTEYAIRLSNYLTRGDGLAYDMSPKPKATRIPIDETRRSQEAQQEYLEQFDEYWAAKAAIPILAKQKFDAVKNGASQTDISVISAAFNEASKNLEELKTKLLNERDDHNGR
ncbi:MAG: hypothetical protein RR547_05830 [Raoultibacter sp.]